MILFEKLSVKLLATWMTPAVMTLRVSRGQRAERLA